MILRPEEEQWLCIPQREHARLAAEIAAVWKPPPCPPGIVWQDLVRAIRHHDDGWLDWDADPQLDPDTGELRSFTDMRMEDSTVLWRESLLACRDRPAFDGAPHHILATVWVGRHFTHLAQSAAERHPDDLTVTEPCRLFVEFAAEIEASIRQQLSLNPTDWERAAAFGGSTVRWFDLLSLTLCLTTPTRSVTVDLPNWPTVEMIFTPHGIGLDPWLLTTSTLTQQTPARKIPTRTFANHQAFDLAWLQAKRERLTWCLSPGG